ncbi:hypothetical protein EPN83_02295 [Patescibacteria group bacterium]|nr:MAG: hypothetical protein EPN83_02295 [Patescibacteria group bacterium]
MLLNIPGGTLMYYGMTKHQKRFVNLASKILRKDEAGNGKEAAIRALQLEGIDPFDNSSLVSRICSELGRRGAAARKRAAKRANGRWQEEIADARAGFER